MACWLLIQIRAWQTLDVPPEKRQKIQTMPNSLLPPVFAGDPVSIRAHGHVLDT